MLKKLISLFVSAVLITSMLPNIAAADVSSQYNAFYLGDNLRVSFYHDDEAIHDLTTDMEYSIDGATKYTAVSTTIASKGLSLKSNIDKATKDFTVDVRDKTSKESVISLTIKPRPAAPAVTTLEYDKIKGIKVPFENCHYRFNNDTTNMWGWISENDGDYISQKAGAKSITLRYGGEGSLTEGIVTPVSKSVTINIPPTPAAPKITLDVKTLRFVGATTAMEYYVDLQQSSWHDVHFINKVFTASPYMGNRKVSFRVKAVEDKGTLKSFSSPETIIDMPEFGEADDSHEAFIYYDGTGNEYLVIPSGTEYSFNSGSTYTKPKASNTNSVTAIKVTPLINAVNVEIESSEMPDPYERVFYREPAVFIKANDENNKYPSNPKMISVNLCRPNAPTEEIHFDSGMFNFSQESNTEPNDGNPVPEPTKFKTHNDFQISANKGAYWVSGSLFKLTPSAKEISVYVRYAPVYNSDGTLKELASNYVEVKIPPTAGTLKASSFTVDYSGENTVIKYTGSENLEISYYHPDYFVEFGEKTHDVEDHYPNDVDGTPSMEVYIRIKGQGGNDESTKSPSVPLKLTLKGSPKTPAGLSISLAEYGISGLKNTIEYLIIHEAYNTSNSSAYKWETATGKIASTLFETSEGNAIYCYARVKATSSSPASAMILVGTINESRPNAPDNLTLSSDKNTVTGVNSLMEYSINQGDTWTSVSGRTIDVKEVSSNIYVRYKKITAANIPASIFVTLKK